MACSGSGKDAVSGSASPIAIIGAGVCGLGIGWRLAQAGRAVTVIDRARAGQGASWAAAGMLAPQVEAEPGEEALLPLLLESRNMWAGFAAELEAASGIGVGYRTEGTVVVALDRDDREKLKFRYDYLMGLGGLALEWLTGAEARRREPHLARGVTGAIASPLDHQVDNRKVVEALRAAFLAAGGTLIEDHAVEELLHDGARVTGVRLADRIVAAETVVLAAGAWSRNIAGVPEAARPPVRPVKGQMLALQMDPAAPLTAHVIWGPDCYLVPRGDGRLVVGATVEEMGFDTRLTGGGIFELLRAAWETLPGIYDLPLVESWAGLRPASRDDAPILGTTEIEGLVLATGHHRNGILLTPITADAISRLVLDGAAPPAIRPFSLERFAKRRDDRSAA
jgi:glycine oxidase